MTAVDFVACFHAACVTMGFPDTPDLRTEVGNAATELLRLAAVWPVGTVVERRGHEIRVRRFPDET